MQGVPLRITGKLGAFCYVAVALAMSCASSLSAQWLAVSASAHEMRRLPPTAAENAPASSYFGQAIRASQVPLPTYAAPLGWGGGGSSWAGYRPSSHWNDAAASADPTSDFLRQLASPPFPASAAPHPLDRRSPISSTFGGMFPGNQWPTGGSDARSGWSMFFASDEERDEQESERMEGDKEDETSPESTDEKPNDSKSPSDPNQRLGEEPEDTSRSFLRSATVLLEPGHIQVDVGLEYTHFELRDLIGDNTNVALVRTRQRQWFIPFSVRYGLTKKVQMFANLPIGASLLETSTSGGGDTTSVFGMGDVQAGYLQVLREQDDCGPDVIFGTSFTAPTGADPFHPGTVAYLGSGFWNVETTLSLIKSLDPAVILAGVSYLHYFHADHLGQEFKLGERFTYDFGAGFAINDTVTFSTILQGSFQFPTEINGTPVPNSSIEPITLRMALTDYLSECKIIEPFVRWGLTADAPQAELGVITTYSR